ncbi:MAG: hypothetical protein ABSG07_04970 [Terriglobales bacterium]|jgi:hypothetical protein
MSQNDMSQNPKQWPWPDALDALLAAPAHHQLLLEDQRVRVLHTRIAAGDVVPLHTHRWGGVAYVQSFSHFIRRGELGEILFDSRQAGDAPRIPCAQWMQPLPPHTVENLGPLEISIIIIELKDHLSSRISDGS